MAIMNRIICGQSFPPTIKIQVILVQNLKMLVKECNRIF